MMMSARIIRTIGAVLSVPVLFAGAACSEDASAETVTSVLDSGAPTDVVTLPPAPSVGQTATGPLSMDLDVAVSVGGEDVVVDLQFTGELTTEVVDVSDDGGYTLRTRYDAVEIESSEPAVVREMERALPDGLTYEETYDELGQRLSSAVVDTGMTEDQREAAEEFIDQAESGMFYAPGAEVGLGATWTATTTMSTGGGAIEMVLRNELSSLTGTGYIVDVSIDSDVDTEIEGEHLTGSITGGGRVTGSRHNPLVMAGDLTIDMDVAGDGMTMTMHLAVDYELTDQPG